VGSETGEELHDIIHGIIDDHQYYPYTDSSTDTWDIIWEADEDPNNSDNIIDIYKNTSFPKNDGTWNREHLWPKSYGFPDENLCNYPYTDCHHLIACASDYNSARSNNPFDFCLVDCTEYPVPGYPESSNWMKGSGNTGTWEVWDHRKGDIARAMFYMDVRYDGGTHGITGCSEPDLILTDNRSLIVTSSTNQSVGYMGILSTLLQWHADDPVDDKERNRNDVIYGFQGNRNPFIDHPEWVCDIWGGVACAYQSPTPTNTPDQTHTSTPTETIISTLTPTSTSTYTPTPTFTSIFTPTSTQTVTSTPTRTSSIENMLWNIY
jgi:endonuclease I